MAERGNGAAVTFTSWKPRGVVQKIIKKRKDVSV